MITGISRRDDPPFARESAVEVPMDPDPVGALAAAFDVLLGRHGLELLFLEHEQAPLAILDVVPRGADLRTLPLPEGSDRESLVRPE